jgi:hypothetical protein
MPFNIHGIQPRTKVLGVYATPMASTSMPLFNWLFWQIFTASKALVARSNLTGQAKSLIGTQNDSNKGIIGIQLTELDYLMEHPIRV